MSQTQSQSQSAKTGSNGATGERFDVIIVGAGFAGMYMLYKTRQLGLSAVVLDKAGGVGGTWYWNRYPGARCDVDSIQYSYSFDDELQQEWEWTEYYATQPEILRYANHVADRHDLRRDMRLNTEVVSASFVEGANGKKTGHWVVETKGEHGGRVEGTFVVMGTGCLSTPNKPRIEGLEDFAGEVYHTGFWPHEKVDFTGKRVAVIGTGSSAIQAIPEIAKEAAHLTVFQRTPNYTIPAQNRPLDPKEYEEVRAHYAELRETAKKQPNGLIYDRSPRSALETSEEERRAEFERRWAKGGTNFIASFNDVMMNTEANELAAEFVRGKIREIVKDPKTAEILTPHNIIGCKRLCVDTDYWATYNRANVDLVDVRSDPIERILPEGVKAHGKVFEVDALVLATGFDAMTGTLLGMNIRGRGGLPLKKKWAEGPRNYLGLAVAGFPNMFTVTGPGSPSVLANMIPAIEQHLDWIADCLAYLTEKGLGEIEPVEDAESEWMDHVRVVGEASLRSHCDSWYVGANVPGKPRIFMPYIGSVPEYARRCNEAAAKGYEGFRLA
jgi:cation diffusion facilitator CzcD-associated flavoprotein CzcO